MSLIDNLTFILHHPLNRHQRWTTLLKWLRWQVGSRLVPGPVAVTLVGGARLLVAPGMTGATGNVYTGLHEFEDMAFMLHLLRPDDLFIDVGANIGSYTILAAVVPKAKCVCFEPIPQTYQHLLTNIRLNGVSDRVLAFNLGVGKESSVLHFTTGQDTTNHVVKAALSEGHAKTAEIEVKPLDHLLQGKQPRLLKIDVEGFETDVVAGAHELLQAPALDAVIMELNGSGRRYGYDEAALHQKMLDYGFRSYAYAPVTRVLTDLNAAKSRSGNTIYVKNLSKVEESLRGAEHFHWNNLSI